MRVNAGAVESVAEPPELHRLGCVSYLNSKPLIDPLVGRKDVEIHFAVPSQLLGLIEAGTVSTGLLSIVDYQASSTDLFLVPAGMIGCDGPTLTVRIFSKVPPKQIRSVYADTDSHTSVILAEVILREFHGVNARVVPLAKPQIASQKPDADRAMPSPPRRFPDPPMRSFAPPAPETMLLIGDKVVNAAPDPAEYPHQLDLGEEWKKLTGLPFVFAMWMMRRDRVDPQLARLLADARRAGAAMTETLLDRHCAEKGWPRDLARRYFTEYLRYEVTDRARAGLSKFFELAENLGILKASRQAEYLEIA